MSDRPLEGRVALVTGASRGIGWSVAVGLAKEGAHVIAVARTVGALEELDDEIKNEGGSATLVPMDLRDGEAYARLAASINERWGKLDILIANAASAGVMTPLVQTKGKDWSEVMDINVNATLMLLTSLDPLLQNSDAGRVILDIGRGRQTLCLYGCLCGLQSCAQHDGADLRP